MSPIIYLFLFMPSIALADYTLNMTKGVTPISQNIYDLHMTIFWICVAIGSLVFAVMFYAIIFHRKSRGAVAAQFHENTTVEIIWTIIPFIILVAMAIPATKVLMKMEDVADSALTIKVTGYMWRWHYEYVGENVQFMSKLTTTYDEISGRDTKDEHYLRAVDKPLVLPINKKVRILTTANDVVHSWWVPDLGIKKDAIPGFINETWALIETPGTYRGQCAELCGARHGFMPIVVEAKTEAEYLDWLQKQKTS
jgi:cytochrome c oxidase subunit II